MNILGWWRGAREHERISGKFEDSSPTKRTLGREEKNKKHEASEPVLPTPNGRYYPSGLGYQVGATALVLDPLSDPPIDHAIHPQPKTDSRPGRKPTLPSTTGRYHRPCMDQYCLLGKAELLPYVDQNYLPKIAEVVPMHGAVLPSRTSGPACSLLPCNLSSPTYPKKVSYEYHAYHSSLQRYYVVAS
jgi:hypothetical protein